MRAQRDFKLHEYSPMKCLGSVSVEHVQSLPAFGWDSDRDVYFSERDEAMLLHSVGSRGAEDLGDGLRRAADYIMQHGQLESVPNVIALTYREMGNLALRVGFRAVTTFGPMYSEYAELLQLFYDDYRDGMGLPRQPAEPCMVYLPTQNFITRFAPAPEAHLDFAKVLQ